MGGFLWGAAVHPKAMCQTIVLLIASELAQLFEPLVVLALKGRVALSSRAKLTMFMSISYLSGAILNETRLG